MRKGLFLLLSALFLVGQVLAQSRTITGKVTSADDGQPIIGATVIVKGTSTGAVTNPDGAYSIKLPDGGGTAVLVFKSVGMKEQEARVGNSNTLNLVMYLDVTKLTETVVTANAIRRDKSSLGYAAPTVKAEELTKGQSTSALNGLSGKVAGVNITSTAGAPGSSSRIVLRGGSSLTGNNQALIVVDGMPIDNTSKISSSSSTNGVANGLSSVDFGNRGNDINPEDIADITILKGPAAAALYGSRASNGAVIITTKSGKKGNNKKNEVIFNSAVTFSKPLKLPEFQNEFGQGADNTTDARENFSWGPKFDGQVKPWGQEIDGVRLTKPYEAQKNNVKNFFELGKMINNNLSLSGAGDKTTYYLSVNSLNADGIMPGNYDKYNKYGIRFNGTAELSNKFTTSVSVAYNKIKSDAVQGGQGPGSVFNSILGTPRDIPIDKMGDLNNPYYSYGSYVNKAGQRVDGVYGYYGAYTVSPYYQLKEYKNQNDVDRVTGAITIGYKPLEWLDVVERVGVDVYSDRRRLKYPKFSVVPIDNTGKDYQPTNVRSGVGQYTENTYNLNEISHDLMVTAKKKFNEDFSGSILIGHNVRQSNFNTLETSTNAAGGLVVANWYNLDNSNGPLLNYNRFTTRRLVGLYTDINLSYKNMVYLGITARNDWSSTLPVNKNSFFYPSVNGSFVFTELLQNTGIARILNYGKIRASWAQVGNDPNVYLLNTYYERSQFSSGFGSLQFPFNGIPGFTYSNSIGNPNLKPEITTAAEIGAELNFFENRLSIDFSYYKNKSKDLITAVALSEASGFASKIMNAGMVENKGIELGVRGTPIRSKSGFVMELYGTYTRNKNTVLDDGGAQIVIGGFGGMSIVAKTGMPFGTFFAPDLEKNADGRIVINPTTGMPNVTTQGQYLGSYNPKFQASWGTNLSYKGFTFNVLFDTKQGGVFFTRTKQSMDFAGLSKATTVGDRLPQVWPNSVYLDNGKYVENTTIKYDPQTYWTGNKSLPAGQHVIDASYIKLRETSLSYKLPKRWIGRSPFGDISVGVFGNNLFIWTPGVNQYADPEINSTGAGNEQGFDFTAQPSLRNFGFNVKVTF